ncbi:hypothetical protein ACQPXB_22270 [Amycolatopsis sp. CA-161197]|uniref:hypothetical protein n=1 Tax=unclassified Amycolatopsis TaxID=2618356 RepID=UPI0036850BFD
MAVPVFPDELDRAVVGQGAEHGGDIGGQIRPHEQPCAWSESGADHADVGGMQAMPAGHVCDVALLQEHRAALGGEVGHLGPERFLGGAPLDGFVEGRVVGGCVNPFSEQAKCVGMGDGVLAGFDAADVQVLVVSDVNEKSLLRFQPAPGTVVAQHGPHQLQADDEGDLRAIVAGETSRSTRSRCTCRSRPRG